MKASLAERPVRAVNARTGLRFSKHTARFFLQDVAARARYWANPSARRAERREAAASTTQEECFEFARTYFGVGPVQIPEEIFGLLTMAAGNGTRLVCEIGAQDAGSSFLLSRTLPDVETLVVMDLYVKNRWRLKRAAPDGQAVHVLDGDSTHPRTRERLERTLAGRKLDLLLIDGDHRFPGVSQDFLEYRRFVRNGGLIAFHDIMPVSGDGPGPFVGDVPAFWNLVKPLYPSTEFVARRDQEGLGIGVLTYDSAVPVKAVADTAAPSGPAGQAPGS